MFLLVAISILSLVTCCDARGGMVESGVIRRCFATKGLSFLLTSAMTFTIPFEVQAGNDPFIEAENRAIHDPNNNRAKLIKAGNNWLASNKALESVRLNTQSNVDVTAASKDADMTLFLIPIVKLNFELELCNSLIINAKEAHGGTSLEELRQAYQELSPYGVKELKQMFNRYSDNIFYIDQREANLYLAGGATPGTLQTQAYLFRNSIITAMGNTQQDLKEMIIDGASIDKLKQNERDIVFMDTLDDLKEAKDAMGNYLKLVEPSNLSKATAAVRTSL